MPSDRKCPATQCKSGKADVCCGQVIRLGGITHSVLHGDVVVVVCTISLRMV
jgi:hypothetical protein